MDGCMNGGATESSNERGGVAAGRERAQWSTLQYEGPPQGGAFSGTLGDSLVVVPLDTRAEVEKSTAPFTKFPESFRLFLSLLDIYLSHAAQLKQLGSKLRTPLAQRHPQVVANKLDVCSLEAGQHCPPDLMTVFLSRCATWALSVNRMVW